MKNARGWTTMLSALLATAACAPPREAGVPSARPHRPAAASEATPRASVVASPDDPSVVAITSSIRKVTVYSDRALVSRDGVTRLTSGAQVYAFKHLPGWVDEGSVRVASSAGRILDVQVARSYLARATEPTYVAAETSLRDLNRRLLGLDDELKVLDAQAKQVEDIKTFSLDRLNHDALLAKASAESAGRVGVDTYSAVVDFIAKKLRQVAEGRRTVQDQREKLAPEVDAAKRRLDDLRGLTQLEETNVLVTVQGAAPRAAELELTYSLPGATWEAAHEFRATDAEASGEEVTSFAVVTQASGEDWDHAELSFSTQSSTAATRIPELEALTLGDTRAATQTVETRSASFKRAEAAFQGQNQLWNRRARLSDASRQFEESYQTSFESLQLTQSKTVQIFQSLQQRGTTSQFKALGATNVRADGRAVRVPIGHATLRAKRALVAAPEQSLNAAQILRMQNDSGQSLLPGGVALYRGGAFLGMTDLGFVADGEDFALFLGVADQLKLSRVLDKKNSALLRKQRSQLELAFIVTVENLSSQPMSIELTDRVPISEDRDIVVSNVKVTPSAKPDSKGLLHFSLTLQPKEKRRLDIQYQLEYPPTLVLEMKRNAAARPAPSLPEPLGVPAAAAPRRARDIRQDIQELEESF